MFGSNMKGVLLVSLFLSGLVAISAKSYDFHPPAPLSREKRNVLPIQDEMKNGQFWVNEAQEVIKAKLKVKLNEAKAKNIILFLGDGMSIDTIATGRILKGQLEGVLGERSKLSFENFATLGLSKTYCVDHQIADSACTSTAYLGGVKGNYNTIGLTGNVSLNDCEATKDPVNQVKSIASWAQKANKSTGLVTTTTVTNASPAGVYGHVANREFESDFNIKDNNFDPNLCVDTAKQLVYNDVGSKLNVVLGGGTKRFLPNGTLDFYGHSGERLDNRNLIRDWRNSKNGTAKTVFNREQLLKVDSNKTDFLMGLFADGNMAYKTDSNATKDPSLEEMTEAAIKILQKNKNGFFLFVEGGHIDLAHHENLAHKALVETLEFSKAVQKAVEMTNSEETLIVVTADHGHTMTFNGYSSIGNNILGLSTRKSDVDGLPYTTLSYANGPSYYKHFNWTGERLDLSQSNVLDKNFEYASTFPDKLESHGGGDVAVFANGPWAHLFSGVVEQNIIPHIMAYASCVGNGVTMCQTEKAKSSGAIIQVPVILLLCMLSIVLRSR